MVKSSSINKYAEDMGIDDIKLHLGCGGQYIDGWINIDNFDYDPKDTSRDGSHYDIKMDIRKLDVKKLTVTRILMVHVLEHFVRWEAIKMLSDYYTLLRKNGRLIIETPDLDKCIEWYLANKDAPHINTPLGYLNMGFTQFYGNQWSEIDFETHRYVWTKKELQGVLRTIGFKKIKISNEAKFHQPGRDIFLIAEK